MHPLQYQNLNGQESLWANHTVSNAGVAGIRWYEIGNLGGTPSLVQQSTFQPDNLSRWMGSMAVDQDGNMALGYSVSSLSVYPGIRYTGRLNGELPGMLTQGETILVQGQGSQTNTYRWGIIFHVDRSAHKKSNFGIRTIHPHQSNWQTRTDFQFYLRKVKGHCKGLSNSGYTAGCRDMLYKLANNDSHHADWRAGTYTMTL
jgi:hypothetical protein